MARCINCWITIPVSQKYRYIVLNMDPEIISYRTEEWISRQVVDDDMVCQACINLLLTESVNRSDGNIGQRQLGHKSVCVSCGLSLDRRSGRRSHALNIGDAEWVYIANLISPLQMPSDARACYTCWVRARAHQRVQSTVEMENIGSEVLPQAEPTSVESGSNSFIDPASPASTADAADAASTADATTTRYDPPEHNVIITLGGYKRTPDSTRHCFVPNCTSADRKRVPSNIKKHILSNHKLYVTMNARVCADHLSLSNWDFLNELQFLTDFTSEHIVQMLDLLRS